MKWTFLTGRAPEYEERELSEDDLAEATEEAALGAASEPGDAVPEVGD